MRFFSLILLAFLFINCQPFPESKMFKGTCIIQNGTSENIIIEKYFKTFPENSEFLSLPIQTVFRGLTTESENPDYYRDLNSNMPFSSLVGDTIIIIFNNERKFGYSFQTLEGVTTFSQPINRNIFRLGAYEALDNDEFLYTITQEDYDNATPCDGPCL